MPHLQTSAGRVAYSDTGSGPRLVLLHATCTTATITIPSCQRWRPATASSPWTGPVTASPTPWGRPAGHAPLLADVLEEVVLEKDLRDLRLIGNSVGGFAAARLAIRHPGRVAGLVLVDNGGFVSKPDHPNLLPRLGYASDHQAHHAAFREELHAAKDSQ